MHKHIRRWESIGALFTVLAGSAMHFVYNLSGKNDLVGIFAAKNESVFEHMKLFFWPFIFWAVLEYFFWGYKENKFFFAKGMAALIGAVLIPVLVYTYSGILGYHILWVDILLFVVATVISFIKSSSVLLKKERGNGLYGTVGAVTIIALVIFFVFTTMYPLQIGMYSIP